MAHTSTRSGDASEPEFPPAALARRSFGFRLRNTREDRGFTQEQLAARIGVSPSSLRRYERGNSFPPMPILLSLRRTLRVSLDYLVAGVPGAAVRHVELGRRLHEVDRLPAASADALVPVLDAFLAAWRPPVAPLGTGTSSS